MYSEEELIQLVADDPVLRAWPEDLIQLEVARRVGLRVSDPHHSS